MLKLSFVDLQALTSQKGDRGEPGQSTLVGEYGDFGIKGGKGEPGDAGYESLFLVSTIFKIQ